MLSSDNRFAHRRLLSGAAALGVLLSAAACSTSDVNTLTVQPLSRNADVYKSAEAEVAGLVEDYRKAMLTADGKRLRELSEDSMSFGHSNGVVQTKEEFITSLEQKKEVFQTLTLTDREVQVVGNTAYARHTFNADLTLGGKPLSVKLGSLQVWRKGPRGWHLVARQAFKA